MTYLARHIEYLLLRHDCVIMPGIGAFIKVYKPAFFDSESHAMIPTRREIIFNGALKTDDGLLANSFARKENISFREGSERLVRSLSAVNRALDAEGEVTIGRIGIISKGEEGNLRFIPFASPATQAEREGLVSVSVPAQNQASVEHNTSEGRIQYVSGISDSSTEEELFQKNGKSEFVEIQEDKYSDRIRRMNFDKNYYIPVNKFATKICASLFALFLLTLMWIVPAGRMTEREERASVMPIDKIIDTAVKKTTASITEIRNEYSESIPDKTEMENPENTAHNEIPILKYENIERDTYYLIVASCRSTREALRYAEVLQTDAYPMEVVESPKMSRVSALSSTDRQSLVDMMRTQEFKSNYKEAWIWSKN